MYCYPAEGGGTIRKNNHFVETISMTSAKPLIVTMMEFDTKMDLKRMTMVIPSKTIIIVNNAQRKFLRLFGE